MSVAHLFKQEATLEVRQATDSYAGDTFDDPVTIDVRWFNEVQAVRTDDGTQYVSSSHISTLVEVKAGDRVTDEDGVVRRVVEVRKNRSTRGVFSHYVAYLA